MNHHWQGKFAKFMASISTVIILCAIDAGTQSSAGERADGLLAHATGTFWEAFENEQYQSLPEVKHLLSAAFLTSPQAPRAALLLGHAHLWRAAESDREPGRDPRIVENLMLAQRWFEVAARLDPDDRRITGWLGSVKLPLGRVTRDHELIRSGMADLEQATAAYPAFNHFTAAYSLAAFSNDQQHLQAALEHKRQAIAHCSGVAIDEDRPATEVYELAKAEDTACGNSELAPYNYQGFLLSLGDLLARDRQLELARSAYQRAQQAPGSDQWPYRHLLDERLVYLDRAIEDQGSGIEMGDLPVLATSEYACAACHAGPNRNANPTQ